MSNDISIQYLEKPATVDEKKIAALLEKTVRAIAAKDVDLLLSAYSDTASIETLSSISMPISKSEYGERMLKFIGKVRNFYLSDAIIRVNGQEATVSCTSAVLLQGKALPDKSQRYLKCVKEDGEWRIINAKHI